MWTGEQTLLQRPILLRCSELEKAFHLEGFLFFIGKCPAFYPDQIFVLR